MMANWQIYIYIYTHTHTHTNIYTPMMGNWKIYIYIYTHTHIIYIKYKYKYESYEIGTLKAQAITKSKENILVWASKHLNIMLYYFHRV